MSTDLIDAYSPSSFLFLFLSAFSNRKEKKLLMFSRLDAPYNVGQSPINFLQIPVSIAIRTVTVPSLMAYAPLSLSLPLTLSTFLIRHKMNDSILVAILIPNSFTNMPR